MGGGDAAFCCGAGAERGGRGRRGQGQAGAERVVLKGEQQRGDRARGAGGGYVVRG